MASAQLGTLVRDIQQLAAGRGSQPRTDRLLLDDFAGRRDEAAFAALVSRHGPMVLRVCRRVLGHEQDAEDAFQATFLVLARHTGSIRQRETVASWLHGVAYRTAMKAKRSAARRRKHEGRLRAEPRPAVSPSWDDVQAILDEEVQRLAPCFRKAFVLCVLEGKAGPEAAAELGCKEGTVKSRVSRARQELRRQLARRGIQLAPLLAALSVAESAGRASVPAALARAAVRSGLLAAAGDLAAGVIPPHVAALAVGVTRAMFVTKTKLPALLLLAAGLLSAACALALPAAHPEEGTATTPTAPAAAAKQPPRDAVTYSGQVVDPAGSPVPGAKVYFLDAAAKKRTASHEATTDAAGRFRFAAAKPSAATKDETKSGAGAILFATAEGYGVGLATSKAAASTPREEVRLQLARDDVPVAGRVLDLQGKPIAGVRVRLRGIRGPVGREDLTAFVEALKARNQAVTAHRELLTGAAHPEGLDLDGCFPPVVTDDAGRFRIGGVGRERVADLLIEGRGIETKYVYAMTRKCAAIQVPALSKALPFAALLFAHYGATFDHVAAPSRPIVGVVRDRDTGKPIAGVVVRKQFFAGCGVDERLQFQAVTDKEGRYRLEGMPGVPGHHLLAEPPADQPYLMAEKTTGSGAALEPVAVDFALKRGVWVSVRVKDKRTGKPVRCNYEYLAFGDNPRLEEAPGLYTKPLLENVAADGTFRVAALPGRGMIGVLAAAENQYMRGRGIERIKGVTGETLLGMKPRPTSPQQYHAVVEVSPSADGGPVTTEVALEPGQTLTGTVLGPDDKPLSGATLARLRVINTTRILEWPSKALETAEFTVTGLEPGETRHLFFRHNGKKLAGELVVKAGQEGPLSVKLKPWGTLTGRVHNAEGNPDRAMMLLPVQGAELKKAMDILRVTFLTPVQLDKEARFRIEGLVPGVQYNLVLQKSVYVYVVAEAGGRNVKLKPGETKDLGDVHVKPLVE
jgi:RNA polymerase sigma factor (sigma-70 family)